MPQLTFVAGRLVLVYYDQRLDHTLGFHIPNDPFAPDAQGRFYLVRRDPKGELPAHPDRSSRSDDRRRDADDAPAHRGLPRRPAPAGAAPSFATSTVSQYRFGLTRDRHGRCRRA